MRFITLVQVASLAALATSAPIPGQNDKRDAAAPLEKRQFGFLWFWGPSFGHKKRDAVAEPVALNYGHERRDATPEPKASIERRWGFWDFFGVSYPHKKRDATSGWDFEGWSYGGKKKRSALEKREPFLWWPWGSFISYGCGFGCGGHDNIKRRVNLVEPIEKRDAEPVLEPADNAKRQDFYGISYGGPPPSPASILKGWVHKVCGGAHCKRFAQLLAPREASGKREKRESSDALENGIGMRSPALAEAAKREAAPIPAAEPEATSSLETLSKTQKCSEDAEMQAC